MAQERLWWLRRNTGARHPVTSAGILIGRSPGCEIILGDPAVSRRQALVYLDDASPTVVPLGSAPCRLGDREPDSPAPLSDGDVLRLGAAALEVISEQRPLGRESAWVLHRTGGGLFGLSKSVHSVGGGAFDDLGFESLPERALLFYCGPDRLAVERGAAEVSVNGVAIAMDDLVELARGDRVKTGEVELRVATGGMIDDTTTRGAHESAPAGALPNSARLEFLPRGGRLFLEIAGQELSVYLAGLRCDLVATLLSPPDPFSPGELVADDRLAAMVWPGRTMGRTDLNTLVYRLRKDLLNAGIDAFAIVEREAGGARFCLSPAARVEVE
jgi:hypothetical protein